MNNIEGTSFILDTWEELKKELNSKGIAIDNENGAANTVILALAKCYGEGEERGSLKGKFAAFESIKNFIELQ